MSGYAVGPKNNVNILLQDPDDVLSLYDKIFYGMKYDPETGSAYVEKIEEGEVIKLPEAGITNPDDYVHYFSSSKNLNFKWNPEDTTRLLLEVI
jgi:hypothetical protein